MDIKPVKSNTNIVKTTPLEKQKQDGESKPSGNFVVVSALCWFAYVAANFGRVNLSIALPNLREAYGYSNTALGMIALGFFAAYAVGQLINGFLGDLFNPRYFIMAALVLAGVSNILFGFSRNINALILFWTINGYVQSMLWGPLVRIISDSTPPKYLSKTTLFFSSSTVCGALFAYVVVGKITVFWGWKMAFFIPGILLVLAGLTWFKLSGRFADTRSGRAAPPEAPQSGYGVLAFLLRSKLWIAALICMLEGSLKEGLTLWGPAFFTEFQALSLERAVFIMSFVPLVNCISLFAGAVLNRIFRYQEKYSLVFFMAAALSFAVFFRITMIVNSTLVHIAFMGLLASAIGANYILTAIMPLNFQKERRVSTVAGFLDCAVYVGAAVSGPLAGFLSDHSGWPGIVNVWILICLFAVIVALFLKNYKRP
jgi:OPA family glycerol-3-phosphate transporter-like MFS transporter